MARRSPRPGAAAYPAVRGEYVGPDTGGYHHYPDHRRVRTWFDAKGLELEDEADEAPRQIRLFPPARALTLALP
jgi:hypothetical protein